MRNYGIDTVYFNNIIFFVNTFSICKKTNISTRKNIDKAHIYCEKKNKTSGQFISACMYFRVLVKKLRRFVKNNFYEIEIMMLTNFLILKNNNNDQLN